MLVTMVGGERWLVVRGDEATVPHVTRQVRLRSLDVRRGCRRLRPPGSNVRSWWPCVQPRWLRVVSRRHGVGRRLGAVRLWRRGVAPRRAEVRPCYAGVAGRRVTVPL